MAAGPKQWVPGANVKEKTFDNGGSILKLGFKVSDLIDFAKQHGNASGWLNLTVSKRQSVGKFGETHSIYLDEYVSKGGGQQKGADISQHLRTDDEIPFAVLLPLVLPLLGLLS